MGKKCTRYERPTSYHNWHFPTQFFCGTVFYICIVLGASYFEHFFPAIFFTIHGLILLLDFRFLRGTLLPIFASRWRSARPKTTTETADLQIRAISHCHARATRSGELSPTYVHNVYIGNCLL
jgi:hypothetical protein